MKTQPKYLNGVRFFRPNNDIHIATIIGEAISKSAPLQKNKLSLTLAGLLHRSSPSSIQDPTDAIVSIHDIEHAKSSFEGYGRTLCVEVIPTNTNRPLYKAQWCVSHCEKLSPRTVLFNLTDDNRVRPAAPDTLDAQLSLFNSLVDHWLPTYSPKDYDSRILTPCPKGDPGLSVCINQSDSKLRRIIEVTDGEIVAYPTYYDRGREVYWLNDSCIQSLLKQFDGAAVSK